MENNLFGEYIKNLREQKNLLQRQVSARLEIDSPMLSKIERGNRKAKRRQVMILAQMFDVEQNHLLAVWLADKAFDLFKDEIFAKESIQILQNEVDKIVY